ncbi:hypothetical protein O181_084608 [Austropuccinia psidii MF-1]|uniref:Uncharacterized protein n=1 Tax=Austropuccinia psidii MF-1 TaxID=1389203 RepID=A0A9Q3FRM6_9BASI|nr:hypothetical protein [Austropuccinia psidii MF-1]
MGPGHGPLGPQKNWAQGDSNSPHRTQSAAYGPRPMNRRPQTMAHGPWTVGPQTSQKGHIFFQIKPLHPKHKKGKNGHRGRSFKNHHRKDQGPKYYGKAILWHFKAIGDKTPLKNSSKTVLVKARKGPTSGWSLKNEICNHILIFHQFLSRRAQWNSFWDTRQGHSQKGRTNQIKRRKSIF